MADTNNTDNTSNDSKGSLNQTAAAIGEVGAGISNAASKAIALSARLMEVAKDADSANHSLQAMATQGMVAAQTASTKTAKAAQQAQVQMGQGAQGVKNFFDGIKNGALGATAAIPMLDQGIGGAIQLFGSLGKAVGDTVSSVANGIKTYEAINEIIKKATEIKNDFAAAEKAAGVAGDEEAVGEGAAAIATEGAGAAAVTATGEFIAMAASEALVVAPFIAIAAAAATAMYGIDKLLHWKEDHALEANIEKGKEADPKLLAFANAQRARRGLPPETQEEYENGTGSTVPTRATAPAPPPAPAMPPVSPPPSAASLAVRQASYLPSPAPAPHPHRSSGPALAALMGSTVQTGGAGENFSGVNAAANGLAQSFSRTNIAANQLATALARAGGSLTIHPKTSITRNGAGHYVLKILPTEVVIPNDFHKAVARL